MLGVLVLIVLAIIWLVRALRKPVWSQPRLRLLIRLSLLQQRTHARNAANPFRKIGNSARIAARSYDQSDTRLMGSRTIRPPASNAEA